MKRLQLIQSPFLPSFEPPTHAFILSPAAQESSSIAVGGADNQITLWDLALEDDPEAEKAHQGRDDLQDIPAQLYFVHQGQTDVKELHWHPQLPGVIASTAADSFHIFKPANAGDGPTA